MGLDEQTAAWLVAARRQGVDFSRTLTIGRQALYVDVRRLRRLGLDIGSGEASGDAVFRALGAEVVDALDMSPYEGATVIQDLNQPVAESLRDRYTAVFDGGSLEHVFNFPAALESCLSMVREGGHFLAVSPANNQMGHGFYQFSPELFFRALSMERGFAIAPVLLAERHVRTRWYVVSDPAAVGRRMEIRSARRTDLYVHARRTDAASDAVGVQQSDYAAAWNDAARTRRRAWSGRLLTRLPDQIAEPYVAFRARLPRRSRPGLRRVPGPDRVLGSPAPGSG